MYFISWTKLLLPVPLSSTPSYHPLPFFSQRRRDLPWTFTHLAVSSYSRTRHIFSYQHQTRQPTEGKEIQRQATESQTVPSPAVRNPTRRSSYISVTYVQRAQIQPMHTLYLVFTIVNPYRLSLVDSVAFLVVSLIPLDPSILSSPCPWYFLNSPNVWQWVSVSVSISSQAKPFRRQLCQTPICKYSKMFKRQRWQLSLMTWVTSWASHQLGVLLISDPFLSLYILQAGQIVVQKFCSQVDVPIHPLEMLPICRRWLFNVPCSLLLGVYGRGILIESWEFPLSQVSTSSERCPLTHQFQPSLPVLSTLDSSCSHPYFLCYPVPSLPDNYSIPTSQ